MSNNPETKTQSCSVTTTRDYKIIVGVGNGYTANASYMPANCSGSITGTYTQQFRSIGNGGWENHIYIVATDVKAGAVVNLYTSAGTLFVFGFYE